MPCQVHSWMAYYLQTYLGGIDSLAAYERFGMDPVIYTNPLFIYDPKDLQSWEEKLFELGTDADGYSRWRRVITTPKGQLITEGARNQYTEWITRQPVKTEQDFEMWNQYIPLPVQVDWTPVREAKKQIGESGIVRGSYFDFGQGSPWQSFVGYLYEVEDAIYDAVDRPEWLHRVLDSMLRKKLRVLELCERMELDLVETGGGAGSSTVISPKMHREFCLPYDQKQHKALKEAGALVVYHLCGGLMPLLEIVAENGAHALETMTPTEMGGDCDLAEASRRAGGKLAFIGGFDQQRGFENGNPEIIREMVRKLFNDCPDGGYICSPSDHFFFGHPDNIKTFVETARECVYK